MITAGASYEVGRGGSNGLQPGYRIEPLNRLAFPKGKMPRCEISGQAATVACVTPHITLYYATEEQAEQAWHGEVTKLHQLSFVRARPAVCELFLLSMHVDVADSDFSLNMPRTAVVYMHTSVSLSTSALLTRPPRKE